MNYREFQKRMMRFTVFSLYDEQKALPKLHRQRHSEWTKKKRFVFFQTIDNGIKVFYTVQISTL